MVTADDRVGPRLRALLAEVLERDPDEVAALPAGTPLFRAGLDLDSLTGMVLLGRVREEFGVDVAAEDLELDSLDSVGSLAAYVAGRVRGG